MPPVHPTHRGPPAGFDASLGTVSGLSFPGGRFRSPVDYDPKLSFSCCLEEISFTFQFRRNFKEFLDLSTRFNVNLHSVPGS